MNFYQVLSEYYDQIFPVEPGELDFLVEQVRGRGSLLDIGCGTGNKTVQFKDAVKIIVGIDLDEHMLAQAKAHNSAPNITYKESDILGLGVDFKEESLDAIICLGNTLPHLLTPDALERAARLMASRLVTGGRIIVQILNYDRIFKHKVQELPVLETEAVKFCRNYRWHGDKIYFLTSLTLKGTGKVFSNSIQLYPIQINALTACLEQAGFEDIRRYGSFDGKPWNEESFITVIIADKLKPSEG